MVGNKFGHRGIRGTELEQCKHQICVNTLEMVPITERSVTYILNISYKMIYSSIGEMISNRTQLD